MNPENATKYLMLRAVLDGLGVYPAAVTENSVTTERSAWQDGWNAATKEIEEKAETIEAWFKDLPLQTARSMEYALEHDLIEVQISGKTVRLILFMNDVFCHAADGERIEAEDTYHIEHVHRGWGHHGVIAWVARRRKEAPLERCQTAGYRAAMAWVAERTP